MSLIAVSFTLSESALSTSRQSGLSAGADHLIQPGPSVELDLRCTATMCPAHSPTSDRPGFARATAISAMGSATRPLVTRSIGHEARVLDVILVEGASTVGL